MENTRAYTRDTIYTQLGTRRVPTSVIGSLIFASGRSLGSRNCKYRYPMAAFRANKAL